MTASISPGWRMAAVFAAIMVTFGVYVPFLPALLAHRGLSAIEIAVVLAVPTVLRIFTAPLLGIVTDRARDRRAVVTLYAVVTAAGFATFGPADGFLPLVLAMTVTSLCWNGIMPGADAIALALARSGQADYGRMRLWGSVSFMVTSVVAGVVIARTGPEMIFWLLLAGFWIQAAFIMVAPDPRSFAAEDPAAAGKAAVVGFGEMGILLADRQLLAILAGAALIQSSHALANGFSTLYWTEQGFGEQAIGFFWGVGILAEILLFWRASAAMRRLGAVGLLILGGAGAVVRWTIYPAIDTGFGWTAANMLHALSFAATHLGTVLYVSRAAPPRLAGAAQGLVVTVSGVVMAIGVLSSGPLFKAFGGNGFWVMTAVAATGLLVVLAARLIQPHRSGQGGRSVEPS